MCELAENNKIDPSNHFTSIDDQTISVELPHYAYSSYSGNSTDCFFDVTCKIGYGKNDDSHYRDMMMKIDKMHKQNVSKNIGNKCSDEIINIHFGKSIKYQINKFLISNTIRDNNIRIRIDYDDEIDAIIVLIMTLLHTGKIDLPIADFEMIPDLQNIARLLKMDYLSAVLDELVRTNDIKYLEPTLVISGEGSNRQEFVGICQREFPQ